MYQFAQQPYIIISLYYNSIYDICMLFNWFFNDFLLSPYFPVGTFFLNKVSWKKKCDLQTNFVMIKVE